MSPNTTRTFSVALSLFVAFGGTRAWAGQPINISQRGPNSSAFGFTVSSDGSRVVYEAVDNANIQLYSAPIGGGSTPTLLNGTLPADGIVSTYQISPNGAYVLYTADQQTAQKNEEYIVPIGGGNANKVNGPLVAAGDVTFAMFSPLSNKILYVADQNADEVYELFRADVSAGIPQPAVKVNPTLAAGGDIDYGIFSPDGGAIVYHGDVFVNDRSELLGVPSDAIGGVRLNKPLPPGAGVYDFFAFSPDGSHILYVSDQDTLDTRELFTVSAFGGPSIKLNQPLAPGGMADVELSNFQYSPNGSQVLYLADDINNAEDELFVVGSLGGTPTKLNSPLAPGGTVVLAGFSPDSSQVIYAATQGSTEIYSVPSTGGSAVKLNKPLVAGGNVTEYSLRNSPDGTRVFYIADADVDDVNDLFSVPSTGGDSTKLNAPLGVDQYVDAFSLQVSPDGSRVLYYVGTNGSGQLDLYLTPSTGGTPVKVNTPTPEGKLFSFDATFTPDGSRVVFTAGQNGQNIYSRAVLLHSRSGGGAFDSALSWDLTENADELTRVFLDAPGTVLVEGSYARTVNELSVGGGNSNSTLQLNNGGTVVALNGLSIANHGIIRGDGQVVTSTSTISEGELRVGVGQHLGFSGPFLTNSGLISALGNSSNAAEFEFDGGGFVNAGDGLIVGQNSVLRFTEFATNYGSMVFNGGNNTVFGLVFNFQGRITVGGGATAAFFGDVYQSAILEVLNVGSATSVATFAGSFTGTGGTSGGGDVIFLGDVNPGASPAIVSFNNNITLGASSALNIELGGLAAGSQYDRMNVVGQLSLAGALEVSLIDGFAPAAGNSFDILDWGTLTGTFASLSLPALTGGLQWNTSQLYTNGVLSVISVGLPGDYNNNSKVDAADYVVWRKDPNRNQAGYDLWRSHFGQTSGGTGSGSQNLTAVPEPGAMLLAVAGALALTLVHGCRYRRFASTAPAYAQASSDEFRSR